MLLWISIEISISPRLVLFYAVGNFNNLSRGESTALHTLRAELESGTAEHILLPANKDRAYTLVSQSRHTALLSKAMSGSQYTPDWNSVKWQVGVAGTVREPKCNLCAKAHKPVQPKTAVPVKTRLYIDTINCVTTPLARYISVMLTTVRERISYRIKDSRHLMAELNQKTFSQSIRIIIINVTYFYPNTNTSDGERVMQEHLSTEQAEVCVDFQQTDT